MSKEAGYDKPNRRIKKKERKAVRYEKSLILADANPKIKAWVKRYWKDSVEREKELVLNTPRAS